MNEPNFINFYRIENDLLIKSITDAYGQTLNTQICICPFYPRPCSVNCLAFNLHLSYARKGAFFYCSHQPNNINDNITYKIESWKNGDVVKWEAENV